MKMMLLTPFADAYLVDLGETRSYDALRALVGGWIEVVSNGRSDGRFDGYANEEGLYQTLTLSDGTQSSWPKNILAHSVMNCGLVVGNVVLTGGIDDEGNTVGLSPADLQSLRASGLMWAGPDHEPRGEWTLPALIERVSGDGMVLRLEGTN